MATPPDVLDCNEVLLGQVPGYGDVRLPIDGGVQRLLISQWPGKQVTGDYSRSDAMILSSLSISDLSGGFLLRRSRPGQQPDRFWYGSAQTDRPGEILPLPATVDFVTGAGAASGLPAHSRMTAVVDYKTGGNVRSFHAIYVSGTGTQIYKFEGGTFTSVGLAPLLANPVTSALWVTHYESTVNYSWMFFADGNKLANFDGGAWRLYNGTGYGLAPGYLAWHDQKLYALNSADNRFFVASSLRNVFALATENFTELATLPAAAGEATGLVVYRNAAGQQSLYAVTARGLYIYDADANFWYETEVRYPYQLRGGEGVAVWGAAGELYVTSGTSMRSFNGNNIRDLGWDRDDGLPVGRRALLTRLCDGYNVLLAAGDASPYGGSGAVSGLYKWTGAAWHPLWIDPAAEAGIDCVFVSGAENALRVWWNAFNPGQTRYDLHYIDVPVGLVNLWDQVARNYQLTYEIVTPWSYGDIENLPKLGVNVEIEAENLAATRTISASYQLNNARDTDPWTLLGTATAPGQTVLELPSSTPHVGVEYRTIRWKLTGTSNLAASPPVLRSFVFNYLKRPTRRAALYSYTVRVNLGAAARVGLTPRQLEAALDAAVATPTLLTLHLRRSTGDELVARPVLPTGEHGTVYTGGEDLGTDVVGLAEVAGA